MNPIPAPEPTHCTANDNDVSLVIADLGCELLRGYGRCAYVRPADKAIILQVGCHHFTLAEARAHWGSPDYSDHERGDEYLALCDHVESLAKIQGITP